MGGLRDVGLARARGFRRGWGARAVFAAICVQVCAQALLPGDMVLGGMFPGGMFPGGMFLGRLFPQAWAAEPSSSGAGTILDGVRPPGSGGAWPEIRVQVVARVSAVVSAPMAGRLAEFPLRDGDRFELGQVLARFVCAEQEGALARAKGVLEEKRQILSTNTRLRDLGTGSNLEYRVAAAQMEVATAEMQIAAAVVANCTVKAPFSGRIGGIATLAHQFVGPGTPLMELIDDRTLDLELIVPSRWLAWLTQGSPFEVTVDETGKTYAAKLIRLSGKVDAVSQSIKAYGALTGAAPELLSGMSGHATFSPP